MTHLDILFDEERLLQLVTNLYVLTGITAMWLAPKRMESPKSLMARPGMTVSRSMMLVGDEYFHISREKHNLDRCRTQFKLVRQFVDGPAEGGVVLEEVDIHPLGVQDVGGDAGRQYSRQQLLAYSETLEALSAYIRLQGMILRTEQTDLVGFLGGLAEGAGGGAGYCAEHLGEVVIVTDPHPAPAPSGDKIAINVIAAEYGQNTKDWWAKFQSDFNNHPQRTAPGRRGTSCCK